MTSKKVIRETIRLINTPSEIDKMNDYAIKWGWKLVGAQPDGEDHVLVTYERNKKTARQIAPDGSK